MATSDDGSGTTTYSYDAAGNQTTVEDPSNNFTTHTWDDENRRLTFAEPGGFVQTATYDADGLRVAKQMPLPAATGLPSPSTFRYLWSGQDLLAEYADDSGTKRQKTIYTTKPEGQFGRLLNAYKPFDLSIGFSDALLEFQHDVLGTTSHVVGIGQQAFKPGVLSFEILEPSCLVHAQPAVLFSPADQRLRRHANLLRSQILSAALRQQNLCFTKLRDNLLRRVTLSLRHDRPPKSASKPCPVIKQSPGSVQGGTHNRRGQGSLPVFCFELFGAHVVGTHSRRPALAAVTHFTLHGRVAHSGHRRDPAAPPSPLPGRSRHERARRS